MRVAVYGIGYVGAVVAACMSAYGHNVLAVDVNKEKVDAVNAGRSPLTEPGLSELIKAGVDARTLRATVDATEAFMASEVFFICVGTPGTPNGRPDLSFVVNVAEQFGRLLAIVSPDMVRRSFIFRSTMLPGTMDEIVTPLLERASGLQSGRDFGLGYMPEFLREGQGIDDFNHPATVVYGSHDPSTLALLREMNQSNGGDIFPCDFRTAEATKFTSNAWHALKIDFANEIGAICQGSGVDGRRVMDILCADTKLNLSRAYMRPGFAFGGSCLPKDVKALVHHAQSRDVRTALLGSLISSNELHVSRAVDIITGCGSRRVLLLGLTFKPETDDLRDSPFVELAERLIGKGFELRVFDPSFSYETLTGRNRQFIQTALPHIASLLVASLQDGLQHADTVVVGHKTRAFAQLGVLAAGHHRIVDLVGIDELASLPHYQGICWCGRASQ